MASLPFWSKDMRYTRTGNPKWKYRLEKEYSRDLLPCMDDAQGTISNVRNDVRKVYAELAHGHITIYAGYAWNGANWFPDLPAIMSATLVHDALCQLIGEKKIPGDLRRCADQEFYCMVRESESPWLASPMYYAIRGHQYVPFLGGLIGGLWGLVRGTFVEEEFGC